MSSTDKPGFTPGPWKVYDDSGSTERLEIVAMGKTVFRIYATKGDEAADLANAHLIAAAPELYEALKRAKNMLQAIAGDIEDGHSLAGMREKYTLAVLGARDAAHDALRKAEGRT